jgi:hypothetical protein
VSEDEAGEEGGLQRLLGLMHLFLILTVMASWYIHISKYIIKCTLILSMFRVLHVNKAA